MNANEQIDTLERLLRTGVETGLPNIEELMAHIVHAQDSTLAFYLSFAFKAAKKHHYEHYLENILHWDFSPTAVGTALTALCRNYSFQKYRPFVEKAVKGEIPYDVGAEIKCSALSDLGEYLLKHRDLAAASLLGDVIVDAREKAKGPYSSINRSVLSSAHQAAAIAMGADIEALLLADDVERSQEEERMWADRFLVERKDG